MPNFVENIVWLTRNTNVQYTDILQWFWFDYQNYLKALNESLKAEAREAKRQQQNMPKIGNMKSQLSQYMSKISSSKFK
jgi:hypothetical protein